MLMSKAEYARYCGVSRQTVYAWAEKGDVVMSGNKIDVEATEHQKHPVASGGEVKAVDASFWPHRTRELT